MVRVLYLHAVGVHCASTVSFLESMESELGRPVHELFDLVVGASMGFVMALLLVRYRLPARDVGSILCSPSRLQKLFAYDLTDVLFGASGNSSCHENDGRTEEFERCFAEVPPAPGRAGSACEWAGLVYSAKSADVRHWRSWEGPDLGEGSLAVLATAATAFPAVFSMVEVAGDFLADAALFSDAEQARAAARDWMASRGAKQRAERVRVFSVGSGRYQCSSARLPLDAGGTQWLVNANLLSALSCMRGGTGAMANGDVVVDGETAPGALTSMAINFGSGNAVSTLRDLGRSWASGDEFAWRSFFLAQAGETGNMESAREKTKELLALLSTGDAQHWDKARGLFEELMRVCPVFREKNDDTDASNRMIQLYMFVSKMLEEGCPMCPFTGQSRA